MIKIKFLQWSKKSRRVLAIGLTAMLISQALQATKILDQWEYSTWAWRQKYLARPSEHSNEIKIILLDQASLDWGASQNGLSWPWPREVYGLLLSFMHRASAKLIAFDVLYSEPSVYGVADDEKFAQAVEKNPVVLAVFLGQQTQQHLHWPEKLPASPVRVISEENELQPASQQPKLNASFPVLRLASASKLLANVTEHADEDGVFRRFSLFQTFDGQIIPAMGLAAFLYPKEDKSLVFANNNFQIGEQTLSTDEQGRIILKFRGGSGTHQTFSVVDIIQSELHLRAKQPAAINPEVFKDKYVFFGFSAPGLKDLRPTPVDGDYPGVEIHATLLDNLLAGDSIKLVANKVYWFCVLLLTLGASYSIIFSTSVVRLLVSFVCFTLLPVILGFAFYMLDFWWHIIGSEVAIILALLNSVTLNYLTEGKQKRFLRYAFNQYLSRDVINQIVDHPERLTLGGEKRELSILFSDIEGFSSFAEKLTPEQLVQLLNDYLSDMTDIIMGEGGTLDKYEGDAIIAFWNAPIPQEDHAIRACRAVLRCQRKLAARREEFYKRVGTRLYVRVGVHTGNVVVGNIGSKQRFDYTMLGDAANLASRLEGANKYFGTYTMVSETTWLQTNQQFIGREVGTLKVMGRNSTVKVYELLGLKNEKLSAEILRFNDGLEWYQQGELRRAALIFAELPNDPVAKVYLARCLREQDNIPENWSGVWVLDDK